jgi:hypothetical protein
MGLLDLSENIWKPLCHLWRWILWYIIAPSALDWKWSRRIRLIRTIFVSWWRRDMKMYL